MGAAAPALEHAVRAPSPDGRSTRRPGRSPFGGRSDCGADLWFAPALPIGQSVRVGYDLHIIRGDDWTEAMPISASEWATLVEQLPDFEMMGAVEATTSDGETLPYENPDLAEWTGHPSGERIPL
jgi:hypothetical protein